MEEFLFMCELRWKTKLIQTLAFYTHGIAKLLNLFISGNSRRSPSTHRIWHFCSVRNFRSSQSAKMTLPLRCATGVRKLYAVPCSHVTACFGMYHYHQGFLFFHLLTKFRKIFELLWSSQLNLQNRDFEFRQLRHQKRFNISSNSCSTD